MGSMLLNVSVPQVLPSAVPDIQREEAAAVASVVNRPRFGCYSQVPIGGYWGLVVPTMISVSTWLPVSSVLSACYCLDRHCVLKSLATSQSDRQLSSASTTTICIPVCCAQQQRAISADR